MSTSINNDGSLQLNRSRASFYQIQGQLNISQRNKIIMILCDFGTEMISVDRDESFWLKHIFPKLSRDPLYIKLFRLKRKAEKSKI
ncbi:hypothetical protein PR048_013114, partial [Dryococelus australis]